MKKGWSATQEGAVVGRAKALFSAFRLVPIWYLFVPTPG